jgi:hypothetical protein
MEKPYKIEQGIVTVELEGKYDGDKDGKQSVKGKIVLEIDAYEMVTEIAKKDYPMVELILKQLKV